MVGPQPPASPRCWAYAGARDDRGPACEHPKDETLEAFVGSACGQQPACQERGGGPGSAGAAVTGVPRCGIG